MIIKKTPVRLCISDTGGGSYNIYAIKYFMSSIGLQRIAVVFSMIVLK